MAENPKVSTRVRPVIRAYLKNLAEAGAYGKGEAGVIRHLIEAGIVRALEAGVLVRKDAREFGETASDEDEDES